MSFCIDSIALYLCRVGQNWIMWSHLEFSASNLMKVFSATFQTDTIFQFSSPNWLLQKEKKWK